MKPQIRFYALPGFLGEANDFLPLQTQLKQAGPFKWIFLDQYELLPEHRANQGEFSVGIGYSFGGRRLLEIMQANPAFFKAVIFLSTHPGLRDEDEKQQRLRADLIWAEKLESLESTDFMSQWNAQPALKSSPPLDCVLTQEQKNKWAIWLRTYSLAHQPNYLTVCKQLTIPQLWLAGDQDQKFIELLSKVQNLKADHIYTNQIRKAGHRLLQMEIEQLAQQIITFLEQVSS